MARMPIRLAVLITRRAISPRLATRTDSGTPGSLQAAHQPLPRDLAERLDHAGVVLAGGIQAQPLQRGRRAVPVGGPAHEIVEGVHRPDDLAADRRLGLVPAAWPVLAADQLGDLVQHPGLP